MRFRPTLTLAICLIAAALAIAGLFRSGGTVAPPTATAPDAAAITIEGFAFSSLDPIEAGATIVVTNRDGAPHTLTAANGEFDTGLLDGNTTASIAAPSGPGTYEFFCELHPSMTGSLTVG